MNQSSFSTNHLEPGIHISAKSKVRLEMMDEFRVPLMASGATEGSLLDLPELSLPAVENLPIIDLFAAETTLEQLVQYGRALKPEQHSCEASDRIVRDFNGNFTCVSL